MVLQKLCLACTCIPWDLVPSARQPGSMTVLVMFFKSGVWSVGNNDPCVALVGALWEWYLPYAYR